MTLSQMGGLLESGAASSLALSMVQKATKGLSAFVRSWAGGAVRSCRWRARTGPRASRGGRPSTRTSRGRPRTRARGGSFLPSKEAGKETKAFEHRAHRLPLGSRFWILLWIVIILVILGIVIVSRVVNGRRLRRRGNGRRPPIGRRWTIPRSTRTLETSPRTPGARSQESRESRNSIEDRSNTSESQQGLGRGQSLILFQMEARQGAVLMGIVSTSLGPSEVGFSQLFLAALDLVQSFLDQRMVIQGLRISKHLGHIHEIHFQTRARVQVEAPQVEERNPLLLGEGGRVSPQSVSAIAELNDLFELRSHGNVQVDISHNIHGGDLTQVLEDHRGGGGGGHGLGVGRAQARLSQCHQQDKEDLHDISR